MKCFVRKKKSNEMFHFYLFYSLPFDICPWQGLSTLLFRKMVLSYVADDWVFGWVCNGPPKRACCPSLSSNCHKNLST